MTLFAGLFLFAESSHAATAPPLKLAWKASPSAAAKGYELRYGTSSGNYTTFLDVGAATGTTVSGLKEGVTYYFAVCVYGASGLRSKASPELAYRPSGTPANRAPNGWIKTPSTNGTIVVGKGAYFTADASDPDGDKGLRYRWSFGEGSGIPNSGKLNPGVVRFERPGTYWVSFTVTDPSGLSDPTPGLRKITVVNPPPNGWISSPSTSGSIHVGDSVNFAGGASDSDGDRDLSYLWNFGEGSGIPDSTAKNPGARKFSVPGTYWVTLTVRDSLGLADPTVAMRRIIVDPPEVGGVVPRNGWKLKYVNSEEPDGYAAVASFDGDPSTFWHTKWRAANLPKPPHEIQIDLGVARYLNGFEYLPRQDKLTIGNIGSYRFYVSLDGVKWGNPVVSGKFTATSTLKRVAFATKRGRYVRLVSLTEANGYTDCSMAEINLLQAATPNRRPIAKSQGVGTTPNTNVRIQLRAADADKNPLVYSIFRKPKRGKLLGIAPYLVYKPDANFSGVDSFSFRVNDGRISSKLATVWVRVEKPSAKTAVTTASAPRPAPSASSSSQTAQTATLAPTTTSQTSTQIIDGRKFLVLTAAKPPIPDGLTRVIEVSPNLVDWYSGGNHTTVIEDNERFIKVRDNVAITPGRKRYIRVRTTSR